MAGLATTAKPPSPATWCPSRNAGGRGAACRLHAVPRRLPGGDVAAAPQAARSSARCRAARSSQRSQSQRTGVSLRLPKLVRKGYVCRWRRHSRARRQETPVPQTSQTWPQRSANPPRRASSRQPREIRATGIVSRVNAHAARGMEQRSPHRAESPWPPARGTRGAAGRVPSPTGRRAGRWGASGDSGGILVGGMLIRPRVGSSVLAVGSFDPTACIVPG